MPATARTSRLFTAWWVLAAALTAPAQDRVVVVQNLAPFVREEWASVVVPFARGEVAETPDLHVEDTATVWQPIGARWPDGSLRQALCLFRTRLDAMQERPLRLLAGAGPELTAAGIGIAPYRLSVLAKVDATQHTVELEPTEVLETNPARTVVALRGRVGTSGLVVEATLTGWAEQEHAEVSLGVFFSDPTKQAMQVQVEELAIESEGMALFFRHARPFGIQSEATMTGTRHVLLKNTAVADGQGIRRNGALVPPLSGATDDAARLRDSTLKAASVISLLAATAWTGTGAFGAYGHVPPPPPWLQDPTALRAAFGRRHAEFVQWSRTVAPDPWRAEVFGLAKVAHQSGEQSDFGVVAIEPVAGSGIPSFLFEVELSVLQEACRPVHFFETDATPVRTDAHPAWVCWDGRTHWNCKVSTDRLGKPCPFPKWDAHEWMGKDREHWSSNNLGAYYLLTGAPWALLEIRNEIELYLATDILDPRSYNIGAGAARAAGRTLQAMSWLYLATGEARLLQRMQRRMKDVNLMSWVGRKLPDTKARPFEVKGPDARVFDSEDGNWRPWEESQTVLGFEAYMRISDDADPELRDMIDVLSINLLENGWRVRNDGAALLGYAYTWCKGAPPTVADYDVRTRCMWPSAGLSVWGMPSLVIGRGIAMRRGRTELVEKADDLLSRLRHGRQQPGDGWFDRFSQWDGVAVESAK